MKKGRPKLKMTIEPEGVEQLRRLYRNSQQGKTKERAQTMLLAEGGHYSYEEIAQIVGRARSQPFNSGSNSLSKRG